jgi:hypothetical protein
LDTTRLASECLAPETGGGVDDDHESGASADVDLALVRDIVLVEAGGRDDGPPESDLTAGRAQLLVGGDVAHVRRIGRRCAQAPASNSTKRAVPGSRVVFMAILLLEADEPPERLSRDDYHTMIDCEVAAQHLQCLFM